MKKSKYNMQLGIMASFTKRIMGETKAIVQRDVIGATNDFYFFES